MLKQYIIKNLQTVTAEEQAILDGETTINHDLYMQEIGTVINSHKLLSSGKLITLRPHTRFIEFPEHRHDYVEVIYVCSGHITQIVNGKQIDMKPGELLFLGQNAKHSILKCDARDIAVNFIVLPEFFTTTLSAIGEEATPLRRFLTDCLFKQNVGPGYLYFKVADNDKIQNLLENLVITLLYKSYNRRKISQMIMTLLFLELLNVTERLDWDDRESIILQLLRYIDGHYADGSLAEAAKLLHCDISTLSREIRKKTGKTYTELVQEKRMNQASFLLRTTDSLIEDIALAVGYENVSYFHRLFRKNYGMSPRQYRMSV